MASAEAGGSRVNRLEIPAAPRVKRAILDKNVVVSDGASIGVSKERDLERGFTVTDSGITVVAKGRLVTP